MDFGEEKPLYEWRSSVLVIVDRVFTSCTVVFKCIVPHYHVPPSLPCVVKGVNKTCNKISKNIDMICRHVYHLALLV